MESDNDELLDICNVGVVSYSNRGKYSSTSIHLDACMDLSEHLQPLMKGLANDLAASNNVELAVANYECKNIFSSGPGDMKQTDLVTHSFDPGGHCPICLLPR